MDVYIKAGEILRGISNKPFSKDLLPLVEEGVKVITSLSSQDDRLGFFLSNGLADRINAWGKEIEAQGETGSMVDMNTLNSLMFSVNGVMESIYVRNGGREIDMGRAILYENHSDNGSELPIDPQDIIKGLILMVSGYERMSEVDLYRAQLSVVMLKYSVEVGILRDTKDSAIHKVWKDNVSKVNGILTQSLEGFYPEIDVQI